MSNEGDDSVGDPQRFTFVCSIFELTSKSGYFLPRLNIRYDESDTASSWFINGGGTRLYINRVGQNLEQSIDDQAADSHFMVDRVVSALLVSGAGLFWATAKGRLFVHVPCDTLRWTSPVDLEPHYSERVRAVHGAFSQDEFGSWYRFICRNTPIRRALHDVAEAIKSPIEAFVYIYRGFEWLKDGLNLSWEDIASDVGVTTRQIKEIGQIANDESGVRHASKSGVKQRASLETYGTWIAGLVHAIESARARIDKTYVSSDPKRIAEKLKVAIQYDPYP